MHRLITYYRNLLKKKILYYKVGKLVGINLKSRLFHDLDLLNPIYAIKISRLMYDKSGVFRRSNLSESDAAKFLDLIDAHEVRSKYCTKYWIAHGMNIVPEEYIKQFLVDKYVECGLDIHKFLSFNRDLFYSIGGGIFYIQVVNSINSINFFQEIISSSRS